MTPQDALKEVKTLSLVAIENGDTPENVEAAAKQIGYLIMHFPSLLQPQQQQSRSTAPAGRDDGSRDSAGRGNGSRQSGRDEYDQRDSRDEGRGQGNYQRGGGGGNRGGGGGGQKRETKYVIVNHDEVKKETANAVCFKVNGLDIWIPRSQMQGYTAKEMTISEWIAGQKELI